MKKQYKTLLIIAIVNIILLGSILPVYFIVWKPSIIGEEGKLTITGIIDTNLVFNITQLEEFPNITQEYLLQGTPTFTAYYTGISLFYIVTEIANITEQINVRVIAIDQLSYTINLNDLNNSQDIIIAYKKNNEYMKGKSQGGEGPLRLIVPQSFTLPDQFNAQYCVKWVVLIELSSIE
ncbi:MAG: molybdopterin-dependent oxidoreductase [Asgard group archaeon]|nr:molybdopterin-dependent oxidoreductase [Asgard group archaeon]